MSGATSGPHPPDEAKRFARDGPHAEVGRVRPRHERGPRLRATRGLAAGLIGGALIAACTACLKHYESYPAPASAPPPPTVTHPPHTPRPSAAPEPTPTPGPETARPATMQQVVGSSAEEAYERLRSLGFEVSVIVAEQDEIDAGFGQDPAQWPRPGTVIGQQPEAGQVLPYGAHVTLRVVSLPEEEMAAREGTERPAPPVRSAARPDGDRDGIPDAEDRCPGTLLGSPVDAEGCADEQLIHDLPLGTYAFNSPSEMVVGRRSYLVTLVLTPSQGLDGQSAERAVVLVLEQSAPDQTGDPIKIEVAHYTGRMEAVLSGPVGWSVVPQAGSAGVQLISSSEPTRWSWDVTPDCSHPRLPIRSGELQCVNARLALAVLTHLREGTPRTIPLLSRDIVVRVRAGHVAREQLGRHWPTVLTGLLIPLLGWVVQRRWSGKKRLIRVLFLAANPAGTSHLEGLDDEARAIDAAIRTAEYRDRFRVEQHWAVRATELDDFLMRHRPDIVHFSGHGSSAGGLMLERTPSPGETVIGAPQPSTGVEPVSPEKLGRLFATLHGRVRCVVLSACFTEPQAQAIAGSVDCVVGMASTVTESVAASFAQAFYGALAYGKDVGTAFELGREAAEGAMFTSAAAPRLITKRGVDAASVVFVKPTRRRKRGGGDAIRGAAQ